MMKKIFNRYDKWTSYEDTRQWSSEARKEKEKPMTSGWAAVDGFVQYDVRQRCERWKE